MNKKINRISSFKKVFHILANAIVYNFETLICNPPGLLATASANQPQVL